ncbi:MAG: DMT family transporter [Candidatus Bathyarchaeia archaeon]
MNVQVFKSDSLLFATSMIWGFAFVAQRMSMNFLGPFTFNGVRFALGGLFMLPLLLLERGPPPGSGEGWGRGPDPSSNKGLFNACLAGVILFAGASLQQVGLVYTTAGRAGFITSLYVIFVPILGLLWGRRVGLGSWIGVSLAALGSYLLSATGELTLVLGDLLELMGAFFWAGHVLIIGRLSPLMRPARLAFLQYLTCSILSLTVAAATEVFSPRSLHQAAIPILYGGLLSVGVAYTLQIIAQRHAPPTHTAIILSLESVFAAFGGWLILGEVISPQGIAGCTLIISGVFSSQLWRILDHSSS